MRYKSEHKQETRQRILDAVHKGFRQHGFDGAGVDGLAREAGVTSGAFYKHFNAKADAFRESIILALGEFRGAVELFQQQQGDAWLDEFTTFYLGDKRNCELGESCGLQSLSPDVARSDASTRSLFQAELEKAARVFAAGLASPEAEPSIDKAWAAIAMLIGGVTLARAVEDPALADQIAAAVRNRVIADYEADSTAVQV
ncbi:MAG: TetR/AcrR family transcriptional regulator [Candidatus Thiodiazotropha sp. (ex Epidulcina cf. delphinae)]|nr:TetR/AcrR family transcriptional regulator [Candidatus Thiodiazotropha sp. (ex Epidulcina cf. delphinae)]